MPFVAFHKFCRFHLKMVAASVMVCTVVQPDYNKNHSFRRNLYDGFTLGVLVGLTWPITIPLFANRIIRDIVDSDPITPQQPIGYPRKDWSNEYKVKLDEIQKHMEDKKKQMEDKKEMDSSPKEHDDYRMMKGSDKRHVFDKEEKE
jgi:hypothetical protein